MGHLRAWQSRKAKWAVSATWKIGPDLVMDLHPITFHKLLWLTFPTVIMRP